MRCSCQIQHDPLRKVLAAVICAVRRPSETGEVGLDAAVRGAAVSVDAVAVIARQGETLSVAADLIALVSGPVVVVLRPALDAHCLCDATQTAVRTGQAEFISCVGQSARIAGDERLCGWIRNCLALSLQHVKAFQALTAFIEVLRVWHVEAWITSGTDYQTVAGAVDSDSLKARIADAADSVPL